MRKVRHVVECPPAQVNTVDEQEFVSGDELEVRSRSDTSMLIRGTIPNYGLYRTMRKD